MKGRYLVFDVETPNINNNRISAIGITVVQDGKILATYYSLVDPETHFDRKNIELTGITPDMVKGKPTFPELWPKMRQLFETGTMVAHNAPFDMKVLMLCMKHYRVSWVDDKEFLCTCMVARMVFPALPNHKLNTLCEHLDIPLDHHNAASDCQAAAMLLCEYLRRNVNMSRFLRKYTFPFFA